MHGSPAAIGIASKDLRITINPQIGGTITSITHLEARLVGAGTVPWDAVDAPIGILQRATRPLADALAAWPVLFLTAAMPAPSGVFHGFMARRRSRLGRHPFQTPSI
jgi:hypothetical protein